MIQKTVYLRPDDDRVTLDVYCPRMGGAFDTPPRPAMLILPGGAYEIVSKMEGEPVALRLIPEGFSSFVLSYSVGADGNAKFPKPLKEVSMAVCHIKENAQEYNVDPDKIFVMGFSAGGHLAAAFGVFWNTDMAAFSGMAKGMNKPIAAVPCYAVISSDTNVCHPYSYNNLCGDKDAPDETRRSFDPSLHVGADTVPMFLWHTVSDNCVPVKNSMIMAEALEEGGIPFELHIYPKGNHGLSLATQESACNNPNAEVPAVSQWIKSLVIWAKGIAADK